MFKDQRTRRMFLSLILFLSLFLFGCNLIPTLYVLTVQISGEGYVAPYQGTHLYEKDTVVRLQATAREGWEFSRWSGDVDDTTKAETSITMNSNKTVVAYFKERLPNYYTLTIEIEGQGVVERDPEPSQLGYEEGVKVILKAIPNEGYAFHSWEGDVEDEKSETTAITIDEDKAVKARFIEEKSLIEAEIKKIKAENGTLLLLLSDALDERPDLSLFAARYKTEPIEIERAQLPIKTNPLWLKTDQRLPYEPPIDSQEDSLRRGEEAYEVLHLTGLVWDEREAEEVLLTFRPFEPESIDMEYFLSVSFLGGPFVEAEESFAVPADETFEKVYLTLAIEGEGRVSPPEGTHPYTKGTFVEIEAEAADGNVFKEWIGEVEDSALPETAVFMDKDKRVTAIFEKKADELRPGGIVQNIDGVSIAAPEGAIEESCLMQIERAADPRAGHPFPTYLGNVEVVGDFYSIAASREIKTPYGNYLLLGLPVPEGISTDQLAIAVLSPPEMINSDSPQETPSIQWDLLFGAYDEKNELFGALLPFLGQEEHIFVLVKGIEGRSEIEDKGIERQNPQFISIEIEGFRVFCVGFEAGECVAAHRRDTEAALEEAYSFFVEELGYEEPRLRHVLVSLEFSYPFYFSILGEYEYQLRKGSFNGGYNSGLSLGWTRYPGHPDEPNPITTRHELFHALQYAYDSFFDNRFERVFGVVEGTAVASELSIPGLTRSDRPMLSRDPLTLETSLFQNTADTISGATYLDYRAQDFWVYVGLKIDPIDTQVDCFIPFLRKGGLRADIHTTLREEGTFESLSDAYWQWAKNQSFEKEVILGVDRHGDPVPSGPPGEWSGHGNLQEISFLPDIWDSQGGGKDFTLRPLSSQVFAITLKEHDSLYCVNLGLNTLDPHIHFKVYREGVTDYDFTDPSNDNTSQQITVDGEEKVVYLLVSNTHAEDVSQSIDITFKRCIVFRDRTLDLIIRELINKPVGPIALEDALAIREVIYSGEDLEPGYDLIQDLCGLEHLENLQRLSLPYHSIEDIALLNELKELQQVDLKHNQIREAALYQLPKLQHLNLQDNHLSRLYLEGLDQLEFLDAKSLHREDHELRSIELLNLPRLVYADFSNSRATSSSFQKVDRLPALEEIVLVNNQIEEINFLKMAPSLQYIHLHSNTIEDIDPLEDLLELHYVGLNNNTKIEGAWAGIPTIQSLKPLIQNAKNGGLGEGDRVDLYGSIYFFNNEELLKDIQQLIHKHGVQVFWSTTTGKIAKELQLTFNPIGESVILRLRERFPIPLEPHLPFNYYPPLYDPPGFAPVFFEDSIAEPLQDALLLYPGDTIILYPYSLEGQEIRSSGQFVLRQSDPYPMNQMQILLEDLFILENTRLLDKTIYIPVENLLNGDPYLKIEPGDDFFEIPYQGPFNHSISSMADSLALAA